MRRAAIAVALLVLGAPGAAWAGNCSKPPGRVVHANRVLTVWLGESGSAHVCLRATGRSRLLFFNDDLYHSGRLRYVAGGFVAYTSAYSPECKADCPPGVTGDFRTVLYDARRDRRVKLTGENVPTIVLSAGGTAAWLTSYSPTAVLHVRERGATRTLDRGRIPYTSLGIRGRTLHWTSAGRRRTIAVP